MIELRNRIARKPEGLPNVGISLPAARHSGWAHEGFGDETVVQGAMSTAQRRPGRAGDAAEAPVRVRTRGESLQWAFSNWCRIISVVILFVGFLDTWSETKFVLESDGEKHYMRGGKPGFYPSFKKGGIPHPVPFDLFDPFGLAAKLTPERKEKALLAEINNGRLAMIGIMGVISASKGLIVPGLDSLPITPYSGEVMGALSKTDAALPFVSDMLNFPGF